MAMRDGPAEFECESKLRKYGMIVTYGTDPTKIKMCGAGGYPRGVTLRSTEKPLMDDVFISNVRIAVEKEGMARVFCRGSHPSINIGDAIQSDASGCGTLLPKTYYTNGSGSVVSASLTHAALAAMVGVTESALASNVSGFINVELKLHSVPKP